jgi:hypothetical protein
MKKLSLILSFLIVAMYALTFTNCKDAEGEKNPLADSLRDANGNLSGQLNEKEAALQEFIASFNEIQENLNAIKEKEKIVTSASEKSDVKSRQGQIQEDIQAIYDLMEKNKNRIGSLSKKLKQSNLKISGLEKMIENLQNSLILKDEEIADLKTKMEGLNIELANLNTNYRNVETERNQQHEALNTAFYAIGTTKELKEKNVITKEGGFIGLGKSTKVTTDFNREYFTKINTEQTMTINIGASKAKVLSNHPSSSYKLVGNKPVEKLEITNAAEFWGASKYLVIVID